MESVKSGGPYVMFGNGQLCACKPISEADLASYMADCITGESLRRVGRRGGFGPRGNILERHISSHGKEILAMIHS